MNLTIKELSNNLIPDYLHFFDDIAFCDNPEWSKCYCCYYYIDEDDQRDTRDLCVELIKAGKLNGFIAYLDKEPVGWLNADNILNYPIITNRSSFDASKNKDTASSVCFAIDPNHRGEGIANALLQHALESFKEKGFKYVNVSSAKGNKSDAHNYHGPLSLYKKNGFEIYEENENFYFLRKVL